MSQYIASLDPSRPRQPPPESFIIEDENDDNGMQPASVSADGADISSAAVVARMSETKLVDLRSLRHVSDVDQNLICSVCHCPFIEPVILPQCEHIFCAECYHAASQQQKDICPFCRNKSDTASRPAPRALSNMAGDLRVECPNRAKGCEIIVPRGSVQTHVDKYCRETEVECPDGLCLCMVARKDVDGPCLHKLVSCEDCREMIMEKDLKDHRQLECQNRWLACVACSRSILHCDTEHHDAEDCPEQIVTCNGSTLGCKQSSRRAELDTHVAHCAFAQLEPIVRQQNQRIASLEEENGMMRRRWDNCGVGEICAQMSAIAPAPPPVDEAPPPPFDSESHHVLASYEALRTDFGRLASQMVEIDARQSMLQLNESLRIKEEFSLLNAVISGMRVQLNWLMSRGLQQTRQASSAARPTSGSVSAGPSSTSGISMTAATNTAPNGEQRIAIGPGGRTLGEILRQTTKL